MKKPIAVEKTPARKESSSSSEESSLEASDIDDEE